MADGLLERAVVALESIARSLEARGGTTAEVVDTAGLKREVVVTTSSSSVVGGPESVIYGKCPDCGGAVTAANGSKLRDGTLKHVPGPCLKRVGKPEPEAKQAAEAKPAEQAAPAKPAKVTADDVRAALKALAQAQGAPAALELLKNVGGAESVSKLPEDRFAAVLEAAKAAA